MNTFTRQQLAITLACSALAVPASAMPIYDNGGVHHATVTAASPPVVAVSRATSPDFDWTDAAIGFGAATGLALLAGGSLVGSRRSRRTNQAVS